LGPFLFAAHNQHDEFARLEEAERNGTITEEGKIKLGEWKGGLSRGGAFFSAGTAPSIFMHNPRCLL
jgi:hypothetical protein